jgi:hypothetical protein
MNEIERACKAWDEAKWAEKAAVEQRRQIEDWLGTQLQIPEGFEGTKSVPAGPFKIKVTGRMSQKVDEQELHRIASIYGTTDQLPRLFRWKAEINKALWNSSEPEVTAPLREAITTKPGRLSFAISRDENV